MILNAWVVEQNTLSSTKACLPSVDRCKHLWFRLIFQPKTQKVPTCKTRSASGLEFSSLHRCDFFTTILQTTIMQTTNMYGLIVVEGAGSRRRQWVWSLLDLRNIPAYFFDAIRSCVTQISYLTPREYMG